MVKKDDEERNDNFFPHHHKKKYTKPQGGCQGWVPDFFYFWLYKNKKNKGCLDCSRSRRGTQSLIAASITFFLFLFFQKKKKAGVTGAAAPVPFIA